MDEFLTDRHGNKYKPVKPYTYKKEGCEIHDCPSNTGFSCELSRYDHPDAIHPNQCYHRKFKHRMRNNNA